MTMDPSTGEGFDAVQVGEQVYFDPNATDPQYPGSVGLEMRKKTFWQGDVEFDTYETVGPKFGPKWPDGTMRVSGLGLDTDVWGLSDKPSPPPGYAPWLNQGIVDTTAGGNVLTPIRRLPEPPLQPKHQWTPCYEIDGFTPTQGDAAGRNFMDITILGAYGGDIRIPVMPEEFGADFTHEYWTPRVVGLGEIIMPGGQSMETISWDSFFPSYYDSDYVSVTPQQLEDPKSLTARIIWTMRFKMDCMLIVGGGIWQDRVVITNFNYRHKAGEIDDIYYSITLKRYRAPVVTTAPNPDTLKDRWPKDPRQGPAGADQGGAVEIQDNQDPNTKEVPVEPEPTTPPPTDHTGGRDSQVTVATTLVQEEPLNRRTVTPEGQYVDINDPDLPEEYKHPGETLAQVMGRVNSKGPNDMPTLLALNQWVTDNNYDPYTSPLKVGSGVRYYTTSPASAGEPTAIVDVAAQTVVDAATSAATGVLDAASQGTGAVGSGLTTGPVGAGQQLGPTSTGSSLTDNTIGMPKSSPSEKPRKGMPPKF